MRNTIKIAQPSEMSSLFWASDDESGYQYMALERWSDSGGGGQFKFPVDPHFFQINHQNLSFSPIVW